MSTTRSTAQQMAGLLAEARLALGVKTNAEVYPALVPLSQAVEQHLGSGTISHFRGGSWGINWTDDDTHDCFVAFDAGELAKNPDSFVRDVLVSRGYAPTSSDGGITITPSQLASLAAAPLADQIAAQITHATENGPLKNPFTGDELDDQIGQVATYLRGSDFLRLSLLGFSNPDDQMQAAITKLGDASMQMATHSVMWDTPKIDDHALARSAVIELTKFEATKPVSMSGAMVEGMLGKTNIMSGRWEVIAGALGDISKAIEGDTSLTKEQLERHYNRMAGASDDNDLAVACSSFKKELMETFMDDDSHDNLIYTLAKADVEIMGSEFPMGQEEYLESERSPRQGARDYLSM